MTIIAAGKRLVVFEIVEEEKQGVLIIPKEKKSIKAVVVSAGCEVDKGIQHGDIVFLPHECGVKIEIEGDPYLSIAENQILGAFRPS